MKKETKVNQETQKKSAMAVMRYIRMSPRKLRYVIDTVRKQPVYRAMRLLSQIPRKGARVTEKVIKSAMHNAKILGLDETKLYVSSVKADGGPVFKRFMSRSMGRADRLLKRTSHLSVVVSEGNKSFTAPAGPAVLEAEADTEVKKKKSKAAAAKG